ncbi:MAG: hypothetical protein Q9181_003158 [Wetmoreana brouardii]
MATTTPLPLPIPNPPHALFNSPPVQAVEEMEQDRGLEGTAQDRSSSLSDIEDRADEHVAPSEQTLPAFDSDPNDTEAETERLEDSPQKSRSNQDVVNTTANLLYSMGGNVSLPTVSAVEETGQASDVASLSDSTAEADQTVSSSSSPRKRKRSDDDDDSYLHSRRSSREAGAASGARLKPPPNARSSSAQKAFRTEKWDNSRGASDGEQSGSEEEVQDTQGAVKVEKAATRRTKKASDGEAGTRSPSGVSVSGVTELIAGAEARDSNPDEAEMEDPGEYASIDNGTKDEEGSKRSAYLRSSFGTDVLTTLGLKKKSAMESLSAIEKCFASLRDKLYDERLAKFNNELAMLAKPNATHPELLGMKEVLEQRRDEKIQYESTLLKYKLGSLQNKSKAEKAQVHGQYMQSVRDIRDRNLEQANKEWYQIHKERRSREDDVPEYMYQFPTRRSQQVTHQTAYNKEVSLLAGIAKHRGFPAAPEICGAKPGEIDSDLERMGVGARGKALEVSRIADASSQIVQQAPAPLTRQPPTLRTSLTANAVLQRPKAVADEHFLEQNPWANPQHPAHLHRQTSALSRTASPLAKPALSKRPAEASLGPRSSFAVAEAHPGRISSVTGPQDRDSRATRPGYNARRDQDAPSNTPRRHPPALTESLSLPLDNQQSRLQRSKASPLTASEKSYPSTADREPIQEMHVRPYIPKVSLKTDSPSFASTVKLPTMGSPTNRYPVIKAEDVVRLPGRSPTPQHYHRPISVNGAAIGAGDRAVGS